MKKLFLLSFVILFAFAPKICTAKYSGGTGQPNNPYRVFDANDMNGIGLHQEDWNKHFVMVNDVNLAQFTATQFNIIGVWVADSDPNNKPFTGIFDGNGFTISNFTYESTDINEIGLFTFVADTNAEIKNLSLSDPNVNAGTGCNVGCMVGRVTSGATITNCRVNGGIVFAGTNVGGLAGSNYGTINNCYVNVTVNGNEYTGGLLGLNDSGTISDCNASGTVTGKNKYTGGLAGGNNGNISNCYATATVDGNEYTGGLLGENWYGNISNCYAANAVNGNNFTGGLMGYIYHGIISDCYAAGNVVGTDYTGGLLGGCVIYSTVTNCCATGTVNGNDYTGGLMGHFLDSTISNCYAAGAVNGDKPNTGGLVGYEIDLGNTAYNKCFWDSDVNPDVNGIGNAADPNVIGKSTAQMQTLSTYTSVGWDFVAETTNGPNDIWTIHDGLDYPKLVWPLINFVGWYEVDLADFAFLADYWQVTNCGSSNDCNGVDLDFSDTVDDRDLKIFCDRWLTGLQ